MDIDGAIAHAMEVAQEKYNEGFLCHANPNDDKLDGCIKCAKEQEQLAEWLTELKEYKQLEEQGLLLKLPCKIGNILFMADGSSLTVREIHIQDNLVKYFVARFNPNGLDVRFTFDKIGKTVFLTQAESEVAVNKMNSGE